MPEEKVLPLKKRSGMRPFPAVAVGVKTAPLPSEGTARQGLSLRANFSWTLVGNFVYAGCQWAMLSVLAKLGTVEMVGQFALGLAVVTPVIVLANLNLQSVQATDVHDEFEFGVYLALRLLMLVAAGATLAAICLFGRYAGDTALVVMGITLAKIGEAIGEVFYGLFLRHERMDFVAVSRIAKGFISVMLFAATIYLTQSLLWAVLLQAVAYVLPLICCDVRFSRRIEKSLTASQSLLAARIFPALPTPGWDLRRSFRLALLALPLAIATVLVSLSVNVPRYFVAYHFGKEELGYFVALIYATTVLDMIVRPLATVAMPRLADYFQKKPAAYLRCLAKIMTVVVVISLAAVIVVFLFGKEILRLLYAEEYTNYVSEFVAITVSAGITALATVLSIASTSARLFRWQLVVYTLNLMLVCGTSYVLIPQRALWGAAVVLGVAAVFRIVFYLFLLGYSLYKRHSTIFSEQAGPCKVQV